MPHSDLSIFLLCMLTRFFSFPIHMSVHCLARPLPYLTSTQIYTHLNKLYLAYIISTPRSWHSPVHLSFLTATLLCGDIQPNPGRTLPSNFLICTLNTRSMLTPEHVISPTITILTSSPLLKHGFIAHNTC